VSAFGAVAVIAKDLKSGRIIMLFQPRIQLTTCADLLAVLCTIIINMVDSEKFKHRLVTANTSVSIGIQGFLAELSLPIMPICSEVFRILFNVGTTKRIAMKPTSLMARREFQLLSSFSIIRSNFISIATIPLIPCFASFLLNLFKSLGFGQFQCFYFRSFVTRPLPLVNAIFNSVSLPVTYFPVPGLFRAIMCGHGL